MKQNVRGTRVDPRRKRGLSASLEECFFALLWLKCHGIPGAPAADGNHCGMQSRRSAADSDSSSKKRHPRLA